MPRGFSFADALPFTSGEVEYELVARHQRVSWVLFFLVLLGFRSALVTCCFAAVAFSCGLRLGGVLVRFTVLLICCRSRSSGLLRYDPTSVHPLHTDRISALLL